jgi:CYTH domain-containing protein
MGLSLEIERKYLVLSDAFKNQALSALEMRQGYLSTDPQRVVRVRLTKDKASGQAQGYLTIKGQSTDNGLSRLEWEQAIDYNEAEALLELCLDYPIEKTRYLVPFQGHTFEVDVFEQHNKGLVLAEIELTEVDIEFTRPDWLGAEVTQQGQYTNAALSERPFSTWAQ